MSRLLRLGLVVLSAGLATIASVVSQAPASYVRTSDPQFQARWELIPAPDRPLSLLTRSNGYTGGIRQPGTFEIAYSLIDEQGQMTQPGAVAVVSPRVRDWGVIVATPGLDPQTRAAGTCWWFRTAGTTQWQILGAGQNNQLPWQVYRPYVSLVGYERHSYQGWALFQAVNWPPFGDLFWRITSPLAPPPAPSVRLQDLDNCEFDITYTWACNRGESPAAPLLRVAQFYHPSDPNFRGLGFLTLVEAYRRLIPPQGALGMYVYLRQVGQNKWHRQPNPAGTGDLWPIDANRLLIERFVRSNKEPAGLGASYLSELHLAMRDSALSVMVDTKPVITCPIISSFERPGVGLQFWRTISSPIGRWTLRDVGTTPEIRDAQGNVTSPSFSGWPRQFPIWVENSQRTYLVNCGIELDEADCGIAFFDHFAGGAFHFRSFGSTVHAQKAGPWRSYGVRCLWESRAAADNDHSASEPLFRDLDIGADFPIVVEGNQSANWLFDTVTCYSSGKVDTAQITQSNIGQLTFQGRLTCDNSRCVVAAVGAVRCNIANIFIDQGAPAWLVAGSYGSNIRLTINGNKFNHWSPWLHAVECPCGGLLPGAGGSKIKMKLVDIDSQQNQAVAVSICAPRPDLVERTGWDDVPLLAGGVVDQGAVRSGPGDLPTRTKPFIIGAIQEKLLAGYDSARFKEKKPSELARPDDWRRYRSRELPRPVNPVKP
jgi:hypothetical protein